MYNYTIGVDISKDFFDVAVHDASEKPKKYSNNMKGINELIVYLKSLNDTILVVFEATGGYENLLLQSLLAEKSEKIAVHRADPSQAAYFIKSLGNKGKTDASDAKALARYGFERQDRLPLAQVKTAAQHSLKRLLMRYDDLMQMQVQEKNRLQHPNYQTLKESVQKHLDFIKEEITEIETDLTKIISDDADLSEMSKILQEIEGVGPKTARVLLGHLPELGTIDRRKIASLAGCAPHPKDSGKTSGYRQTKGGRALLKKNLFVASLAACRTKNSVLSKCYRSLVGRGVKEIKAVVAVMRKIVVAANAKIRDFLIKKSMGNMVNCAEAEQENMQGLQSMPTFKSVKTIEKSQAFQSLQGLPTKKRREMLSPPMTLTEGETSPCTTA